jgi:rubrerythrin
MITFNADEVFEMAEQIERNGAAFYRKAAENFRGQDLSKVLLDLAAMEDDHERTFKAMRSELPPKLRTEEKFDPTGEGALYLHAMVQGKVFEPKADPARKLAGAEKPQDILRAAIEMEKNSIVFYLTIKKMVRLAAGLARIDDIIEQELGHVATLSKQLAAVGD